MNKIVRVTGLIGKSDFFLWIMEENYNNRKNEKFYGLDR